MKRALPFLLLSFLCLPAQADIYTMVDANGRVHYSNVPTDSRYRLYMREKTTEAGRAGRVRPVFDRRTPGGRLATNALMRTRPYHKHVLAAAKEHNLDPALIHAVIAIESAYRPGAISPKGAIGLMQVMPATAARFGGNAKALREPDTNISIGARYLAWLLDRFNGDIELALAGYNAGEQAVIRHGERIPPYAETRAYVPRVLQHYQALRGNTQIVSSQP